jgi:energy-coupling factor transporter ATP-binding protein EcfA2
VAAIQTLHQNDRLHRDIKPSNILVTPEGRLVLLDFGLTTVLDALDGDSLAGRPAGTPLYMAPECISGMPVSPTADWYSLGIVLYELLVGEVPWTGHQRQVLYGKRYGPIPRASARVEVAAELDQLIADLLQVDPDLRPDGDAILSVLARLPSVQMPIPPRRPDRTERRLPFVGRAQEIGRLLEALESVDSHAPSVALVTGPSGIGKSELVQHFALRMRGERGAHVLRGRCNLREAVPYKGFDQIIDGVVNWLLRLDPRTLQEVMPREPWPLFRLFPVMGKVAEVMPSAEASDPGQPVEPAEMRRRGLLVLRALLVEMAAERPLIVWIDDVHWADSDFASVLAELLVGADAPGLLWILGFRDDGTPDSAVEELDAVWDRCGIEPIRLSLGPLEPRHVRALVSELFPVGRSDEDSVAAWTEQILQAGGDIPFLLSELVRQITHLGPSEAIDAASLVLRRAATLPADGRRILDVVCVIGRWVDRRLVWAVGTLQEGAQIAIFELERARFIRISRMDGNVQVAPYHDKVREAVVAALSDEDRRELHRKVVEAMLARNQPGVDIIDHWIGAGEPAQAARAARTAAEHALQTLAFREAARLFGQAIDLGGADPILLERHAEALVFAGRNAQAAARYQALAARDAPAPELLRLRAVAGELLVRSGQIEAGMEASPQ